MKLYVGNLAYSVTDSTLRELFGDGGRSGDVFVTTSRTREISGEFCLSLAENRCAEFA